MNEIIYKVRNREECFWGLERDDNDFSIWLNQPENIFQLLPPVEYVKYQFFNTLFNSSIDNHVEDLLNFHFDNYTGDKSDFLRIFKLDIDEIYESFEIPWREKKVLTVDPITGRIHWDISKIIIKDVLPFFQPYDYIKYLKYKRRYKEAYYWIENKSELMTVLPPPDVRRTVKLLNIPTRGTPEQIHNYWLRLQKNNEKGEPYWDSKKEIEHFIYQNFEVFPGVDEIKVFNPNMSKSELNHVTWTFYRNYGSSKTKRQYEKLLMQNFTKFKNGTNVYSNIKDQNNEHLKQLFK